MTTLPLHLQARLAVANSSKLDIWAKATLPVVRLLWATKAIATDVSMYCHKPMQLMLLGLVYG